MAVLAGGWYDRSDHGLLRYRVFYSKLEMPLGLIFWRAATAARQNSSGNTIIGMI
jgi:hypothetical protein